ncbi:MAG: T9SS type A sorting domain-containing protein [Sphingobacteriales bacterium]|nr:MAG: T9SS type A sorting domain-containing protein [Sphingobacteriales bacterium]
MDSQINRTYLDITSEEEALVREIAATNTLAAMDARVALYIGYGEEIYINLPQFPQVIAESISQLQLQFKNQPDTHVCSIVPNPATNIVLINYSLPDEEHAIFTVYDISGKTVYKQMLQENGSFSIDISQWVSGMYYCRLLGSQQTNISRKLIVANK